MQLEMKNTADTAKINVINNNLTNLYANKLKNSEEM